MCIRFSMSCLVWSVRWNYARWQTTLWSRTRGQEASRPRSALQPRWLNINVLWLQLYTESFSQSFGIKGMTERFCRSYWQTPWICAWKLRSPCRMTNQISSTLTKWSKSTAPCRSKTSVTSDVTQCTRLCNERFLAYEGEAVIKKKRI